MCIEGRYLDGDQGVKVVFSSLKNVPYVGLHTVCLRVLCMHKKVRRSPMNCQYKEGSFTKCNGKRLCVGKTLKAPY